MVTPAHTYLPPHLCQTAMSSLHIFVGMVCKKLHTPWVKCISFSAYLSWISSNFFKIISLNVLFQVFMHPGGVYTILVATRENQVLGYLITCFGFKLRKSWTFSPITLFIGHFHSKVENHPSSGRQKEKSEVLAQDHSFPNDSGYQDTTPCLDRWYSCPRHTETALSYCLVLSCMVPAASFHDIFLSAF